MPDDRLRNRVQAFTSDATQNTDDDSFIKKEKFKQKNKIKRFLARLFILIAMILLAVGVGINLKALLSTSWWKNIYNMYTSGFFQFCFFSRCSDYGSTTRFGNNFNLSRDLLISGDVLLLVSIAAALIAILLSFMKVSIGLELVCLGTCIISSVLSALGLYYFSEYINRDAYTYGHRLHTAFYSTIYGSSIAAFSIPFSLTTFILSQSYSYL